MKIARMANTHPDIYLLPRKNIKMNVFYFMCTLFSFFFFVQSSFAQNDRQANFLGVAIYRLAEHITWPNAEKIKQYRIHIIDDNPKVETILKNIAITRQLHNRPMLVSFSNNATIPDNTHVIFLAKDKVSLLKNISKQTKHSNTLIISFGVKDQRNVMINFIANAKEPTKIKFEINKANILNKNMSIDPDIILLGGTEIDVAHLYRDAQTQLSKNKKELISVVKKIRKMNQEKYLMEQVLSKLVQTVKQQKNTVTQQKKNYIKLEQEAKIQEDRIHQQVAELHDREIHLNKQRIEIEKRSATLNKQQNEIDTLAVTISAQNAVIKSQKETLSTSNATIESQQSYLFVLSILIALAVFSAITAYFLYRKYQRVNLKLLESLDKTKQYADRIEIANEQLQSFSYTVSHDLRAPLRSITGFSQILIEDYNDILNEEGKDYLNRITQNIARMDNLITEILMLSKLTQSEIKYSDNINLSNIINTELKVLIHSSPRTSLDLNIEENVLCQCDPALIQIVITNLIGNAWKYPPATQDTKFEFGTKTINNERVYYFKDNGVGFDMTLAGKLFEPFQRLHSIKQFEGTGIGLATVKRIINLHHGKIWAESEVGLGSTFYFTLFTN